MRKNRILFLTLILSVIVTLLPLMSSQWFFTHDFVHGARIAEYSRGLIDGQFPVVWSKNFGYGYGMPLFLFYAPLPYLIGSFFYLIGIDLVTIVKILYLVVTIIGGLGVFLLVRKMFNTTSGLLGALVYIFTPYRALNLYVRGAVSETFGMAFSPFVLWGVWLAWQRKWYGPLVLAVSLFLVALSHNLSLLLILPIALAWLGYLFIEDYWIKKSQTLLICLKSTKEVLIGLFLGLGMSAFYLIPAAFYQNLTKLPQIVLSGYSDYRHHFLYIRQFFDNTWGYGGSNWGPVDGMSFFLGYAPLFGLGFAVGNISIRLVRAIWQKNIKILYPVFRIGLFIGIGLTYLLFSTPKVQFIWEHIGILRVLQFPWRFLGPVSLVFAVVAGGSLTLVKTKYQKLTLIVLVILSGLVINYFKPDSYLEDNQGLYYSDPGRIARDMSGILPDYIPRQIPDDIKPAGSAIVEGVATTDEWSVLRWNSKQLIIKSKQNQTSNLTLAVANFPGWQAKINHQPVEIKTNPAGLISVIAPIGNNTIELNYNLTLIQKLSLVFSLISLIILGFISYHDYQKLYEFKKS